MVKNIEALCPEMTAFSVYNIILILEDDKEVYILSFLISYYVQRQHIWE